MTDYCCLILNHLPIVIVLIDNLDKITSSFNEFYTRLIGFLELGLIDITESGAKITSRSGKIPHVIMSSKGKDNYLRGLLSTPILRRSMIIKASPIPEFLDYCQEQK